MKTLIMLGIPLVVGLVLGIGGAQYAARLEVLAPLLSALSVPGASSRPAAPAPAVAADQHEHGHEHDEDEKPEQGLAAEKHAHSGHGHDDEKAVRLSAAQLQQLGIDVAVARAGSFQTRLSLSGTVTVNTDRRVHVVPRVPGRVREVRKNLGDVVRAGEVLAVLESRELADAKAAYLAARERVTLAETTFTREKTLWDKRISPEEDFLKARQTLAEVRIELRLATQKLLALGTTEAAIKQLVQQADAPLTPYELVAPFTGTIVEKRLAVGAILKDDSDAFVIADLSTVWVDLTIAPKDVPMVRKGQRVLISTGPLFPEAEGTLSYVSPMVAEETRTVMARVVLPNPDGRWRPGTFVTATVAAHEAPAAVLIPPSAIQTVDGQPTVFVQTAEGFVPRVVTLGRSNATHVEIPSGLQPGERYAATETFVFKADLGKGTAEHQH